MCGSVCKVSIFSGNRRGGAVLSESNSFSDLTNLWLIFFLGERYLLPEICAFLSFLSFLSGLIPSIIGKAHGEGAVVTGKQ